MFMADAALVPAVAEADWPEVWEAEPPDVELAVSEAPEPELERVDEAVEEALSELELEVVSSRVLLPQTVSRQVVIPSRSLGWALTHCSTYCWQTKAGRVCW
jgi:hypothetical protein